MWLFLVVETFLLFFGLLLCFALTAKGDPNVVTNVSRVLNRFLETLEMPPLPGLDVFMWLRLLALLLLAIAMTNDFDFTFRTLNDWWDNVFVYIWGVIADLGHVVVYLIDLVLPFYNLYVTIVYQLTRGSYLILAKCQVRSIVEGMIHLGDAMLSLALSFVKFVASPRGAFDIYDTTISLQQAVLSQESVLQCACDGVSPVFALVLDVVRSDYFGNISNESLNVLLAFPQTLVLCVPPFLEVPDGSRIFGPLKRLSVSVGFFFDEGLDRIVNRLFGSIKVDDKPIEIESLPIFSIFGYLGEAAVGIVDMSMHTSVRLLLGQSITYEPKSIYVSVNNSVTSFETTLTLPMNLIGNLFDVDASPIPETVGYLVRAIVGLPLVWLDLLFFMLRGDFIGLSFMEILQHMDGRFGEDSMSETLDYDKRYISLQTHFFQNLDAATYEAEQWTLTWRFIPITFRVASRLLNVLIRLMLSSGDIVHGDFFHVPINCGYGENKDCTRECTFYYDPDNPYLPISRTSLNEPRAEDSTGVNPCNSLIIEWVFDAIEDFANSFSGLFQVIRPQHSFEWCERHEFPKKEGRCAVGNTDFFCATSNSVRQVIDVPLDTIRHLIQKITFIWSEEGDIMKMAVEDRLCDISTVLYALSSNMVALLPTEYIADTFERRLTDVAHAFLVLPVEVIRALVITFQFLWSVLNNEVFDWESVRKILDDQLISEEFVFEEKEADSDFDMALAVNTGNYLGTMVLLLSNQLINIFTAFGELFGGSNAFNLIAEIFFILKSAVSQEMINLVILIFKVFSQLLSMLTTGDTDLGDIGSDLGVLITKFLGILGTISSSILASLLNMLGPIGEFLLFLWRALCDAMDAIEFLTGADFGSVCDAAEVGENARRRLPEMQSFLVNGTGWNGKSECDLLSHHYDGTPLGELVYLEQVRIVHCMEQRAMMHRASMVLNTTLPEDFLYNWKRKYLMGYEAVLGFILYNKYDHRTMLVEWDRLELPRYWLDLWTRLQIRVPWLSVLDEALLSVITPVPELSSMYSTAKGALLDMHATWKRHDVRVIPEMPDFGVSFGSEYVNGRVRTVVSNRQLAWGLKSDIDVVGPLNCSIVDNFFWAVGNASQRVAAYYEGPFVEHVTPQFIGYLRDTRVVPPRLNNSMPEFKLPSVDGIKAALLYNFELCEAYDVTCRVDDQLDRVHRITESLWYIGYTLVAFTAIMLLTGFSLFTLNPLAPLIVYAHTWNYRFTCMPNIPECMYDDVLLWMNVYHPYNWTDYFPILTNESAVGTVSCPVESPLWSSVYFLGKTSLVYPLDFVLYWTPYYDDFVDWVMQSAKKDECLWLRGVEIVYLPIFLYGLYTLWGVVAWALMTLTNLLQMLSEVAATTYGIETAFREAEEKAREARERAREARERS